MDIAIIVAMANNRVIGCNNALPWHLPEDLRHFKAMTMGKPLIMGRKTFDSIGRPLPGRQNIVVTRQDDWRHEGVITAPSLEAAIRLAESGGEKVPEVMVIGGADIYRQALPLATRLYLTKVDMDVDGDAWFPAFDPALWQCTESVSGISESSGVRFQFDILERAPAA